MSANPTIMSESVDDDVVRLPWWERAIRDHMDEHGPSGPAWNISAALDRLRKAAALAAVGDTEWRDVVRQAYEEGVEDGSEWATDRIMEPAPQWIDSVARINVLKRLPAPPVEGTVSVEGGK